MLYVDVRSQAAYILKERDRVERSGLIAASFSAYQILSSKTDKMPTWGKYLKNVGLSDEPKLTKEDLKREADQAMANAQRIIDKAKAGGVLGSR